MFKPVLDAIRELGRSARPSEVKEWILKNRKLTEQYANAIHQRGESMFGNDVDWLDSTLPDRVIWIRQLVEFGRLLSLVVSRRSTRLEQPRLSVRWIARQLRPGYFTPQAENEASLDGAQPIELVDGKSLIQLLGDLSLGLRPVKSYEIDEPFFRQFE